jgi:hypothetical protein
MQRVQKCGQNVVRLLPSLTRPIRRLVPGEALAFGSATGPLAHSWGLVPARECAR